MPRGRRGKVAVVISICGKRCYIFGLKKHEDLRRRRVGCRIAFEKQRKKRVDNELSRLKNIGNIRPMVVLEGKEVDRRKKVSRRMCVTPDKISEGASMTYIHLMGEKTRDDASACFRG